MNGVKIFTKGGNYIPEDAVYPWITRERQAYLLKSCVRANFNCVRVWGGGYYPSDAFYDLCDEYGLIVWQDLMYALHCLSIFSCIFRRIAGYGYSKLVQWLLPVTVWPPELGILDDNLCLVNISAAFFACYLCYKLCLRRRSILFRVGR